MYTWQKKQAEIPEWDDLSQDELYYAYQREQDKFYEANRDLSIQQKLEEEAEADVDFHLRQCSRLLDEVVDCGQGRVLSKFLEETEEDLGLYKRGARIYFAERRDELAEEKRNLQLAEEALRELYEERLKKEEQL